MIYILTIAGLALGYIAGIQYCRKTKAINIELKKKLLDKSAHIQDLKEANLRLNRINVNLNGKLREIMK